MTYRFGPFGLDAQREQLWREDRVVPLNPKAMRVLVTLIEHHGEVVTKEDLLSTVWPGGATANNLSQHVFMLRSALGEGPGRPQYVLTVPSVGYRFVAPLELGEGESAQRVIARDYCEIAREFRERRTFSSLERAIELYECALRYDSRCVEALAEIALCRLFLAEYLFESPRAMLEKAEADALRAIELDRGNPIALLVLARAATQMRYHWAEAETLLLDALRSRPQYLGAHLLLIEHYAARGRFGAARQALLNARSLGVQDEAFPRLPLLKGLVQYFERSFDAARIHLTALLDEHPSYAFAHFLLAKTLLAQGEWQEALRHTQAAASVNYDPLQAGQPNVRRRALALAVFANAAGGDREGVHAAAAALDAQTAHLVPSAFCSAIVALAHERRERALTVMQHAVANHESMTYFAAVEPLLDPLHALPGWQALLRAMNLATS